MFLTLKDLLKIPRFVQNMKKFYETSKQIFYFNFTQKITGFVFCRDEASKGTLLLVKYIFQSGVAVEVETNLEPFIGQGVCGAECPQDTSTVKTLYHANFTHNFCESTSLVQKCWDEVSMNGVLSIILKVIYFPASLLSQKELLLGRLWV